MQNQRTHTRYKLRLIDIDSKVFLAGKADIKHLCVREIPRSGKPEELLDRFGISARRIVEAVKSFA